MSYYPTFAYGSTKRGVPAIDGPLSVHRHGSESTRDLTWSFADRTGPRRLVGFSWFCAVTDYHQWPSESEDVMGLARSYGYTFFRSFRELSYDYVNPWGPDVPNNPGSYFGARGVSPVTAKERNVALARAARRHGLRIQSTSGHDWNSVDERLRYTSEFWATMQSEGVLDVFIFADGDNEGFQNASPFGDSDDQQRLYARIYREIILPLGSSRPLFSCGAPGDESPSNVWQWMGRIQQPRDPHDGETATILQQPFADVGDEHTSRDETDGVDETIKRPFSLGYNEGRVGMYGRPLAMSEPRPPVGPAAFSPSNKPGRLVAAYGAGQLWGSALTYFAGEGVRGESRFNNAMRPLNVLSSDGFAETPKLMDNLPQNVGDSSHVPGGNIWWWALPDDRIATVVSELWPGDTLRPPVPIKRSLIIGPNWEAREIARAPLRSDIEGHGGALIVAERA